MNSSLCPRRFLALLVCLAGVAFLSRAPLDALVQPPPVEEKAEPGFGHDVKLPIDPRARRKVQEARRLIAQQEWSQAIRLLQSLLDNKEDSFLPDEAQRRHVSIRAEANRLLGTLPREGRQFYELEFGSQAKALLSTAREQGDPRTLGEVAVRFQHTEAGAEAAALLGTYYLDQGQYFIAALWFERLLAREDAAPLITPLLLLKAALAFERGNMPEQRQKAFEAFLAKVDQPGAAALPAPLRGRSVEQWQALLVSPDRPKAGESLWLMHQGRADRAGQAVGEAPFLEARSGFPVDVTRPLKMTSVHNHDGARRLLEEACKGQARFHQPILSGHHPIGVDDLLIYRGAWGLHAFNLRTGTLAWEHPLQASLAALTSAAPAAGLDLQRPHLEASSLLYENSMIGILSSDRHYVYVIEDLAVVPAIPDVRMGGLRGGMDRQGKWAFHNELVAYDLKEGLPAWVIGTYEPDQPFSDCFFLGAPLPLGDQLYVLAETAGEIRLLCLENRRVWDAAANRHRATVAINWSQALCQVNRRLPDDPGRRLHAALLSYGDGMLICPTNAGVVIAVDLLTRSLMWAHAYQVQEDSPREQAFAVPAGVPIIRRGRVVMNEGAGQPLGQNTWAAAAPIIYRGYVIFTAPDAKGLHVLNLRDGTLAWRRDRQSGQGAAELYLAGVDGDLVLLVGHKSMKALSLSQQGRLVWETPLTGLPSGRGIISKGLYYLPLRSAEPRDKAGGEIWTLDVQTGAVVTRNRVRHDIPGNLIFLAGDLASQNVLRLSVFPQLASKEREIAERLTANPNDPVGLAQRGELKIHRGELKEGVADLRAGLAGVWTDESERRRAREKLFDALCDLVERQFHEHEADLEELTALAELPAPANEPPEVRQKRLEEITDRRARVVRLVGRGREAQGRFVEALKVYLDFVPPTPTLLQSPEDPAVQIAPQRWVQARVRELFLRAPAPQRAAMLTVVEERWSQTRTGDLESLSRFAELFGPLLPVGREALLLLAEKLIDQSDFAQARLHLLYLLEVIQEIQPATSAEDRHAARALDALARLNLKQNLPEDAAYYFKKLATRYPQVPVRDGKTGLELYLELTTDKRFLPFLSQRDLPRRGLLAQPYTEITRLPATAAASSVGQGRFWATFVGDVTPLFQRHRLGIDPALRQARFIDVNTEADRGGFPMEQVPTGYYSPAYTTDGSARPSVPAYALGQLVLFNWANHVYAYDLVEGKRRWKIDLLAPIEGGSSERATSLVPGPNGRFMILHASRNFMEPVGTLGPVTAQNAVLLSKAGLQVIDPLTQQPRWSRDDITPDAELFGDDQLLLLYFPRAQEGKRGLALSMIDGTRVEGLDVVKFFNSRIDTCGRHVLLWDEGPATSVLRLFDPLQGRDLWKIQTPGKANLVKSFVPATVAVVEPDGTLQALELATGKKLFSTRLDAKTVAEAKQIYLLADALHWYIAFLSASDQPNQGMRFAAVYNVAVLRTLPIHGPLLALDRATGELRWQVDIPQQGLILEQFEELPLVLCASFREVRLGAGPNNPERYRYVSTLLALDKRDGRVIDRTESPNGSQYTALRVDAAAGRIELLGHPLKAGFQLRGD